MLDIEDTMLGNLKTKDYEGFIKIGMEYADAVVRTEESYSAEVGKLVKEIESQKKTVNTFPLEMEEGVENKYFEFYNELAGI